jgi:pimeloyl-ACP methyl ester carboxylesterase
MRNDPPPSVLTRLTTTIPGAKMERQTKILAGAAAAALAGGLWLDSWRRVRAVEAGFPQIGEFTPSNQPLHYIQKGSGRDVVVLHGAWVMLQDLTSSGLVDTLAQRWRVTAFDRPGYGFSPREKAMGSPIVQARVIRDAVRSLGIEQPIIVGHSYGGPLALAYAAQFPDEVAGVVFMSGLAFPTPRMDLLPFMLPATPLFGEAVARTMLPAYEALLIPVLRLCFAPRSIPEAFTREMPREMMLRAGQLEAAAEDLAALVPALGLLQQSYREIETPVAILSGEQDRIASPGYHAVGLSRQLPHASLRLLPGLGHMLHHFRPDAVAEAVADVEKRERVLISA